jgi:hypothetical protein
MRFKALLVVVAMATAGGALWLACNAGAQPGTRVGQPAPEITGGPWINSEPLSMQKLRGQVVYVEFWTYG